MLAVSNDEYEDAVVVACELVWGKGNLAPGGDGNLANLVEGIDVGNRRVLDIGCGSGGPACTLASKYGARVVGSDLEAPLLRRSLDLTRERGVASSVSVVQVEPGPLAFRDERPSEVEEHPSPSVFHYIDAPSLPSGSTMNCTSHLGSAPRALAEINQQSGVVAHASVPATGPDVSSVAESRQEGAVQERLVETEAVAPIRGVPGVGSG